MDMYPALRGRPIPMAYHSYHSRLKVANSRDFIEDDYRFVWVAKRVRKCKG